MKDNNSLYWKIYPSIAKRIQCVEDLNDFLAYMDDLADTFIEYKTQEEYLDKLPTYLYMVPLTELDRINEFNDEMYYEVGSYNEDNVKRILGRYFGHEKDRLLKTSESF